MPAQTVIKIRRDTSTNWDSVNPTLAAGEIAFETDTNKIKVGDGSTVWASLDYASGAGTAAEITYDNVDAELIATTVKGALDELSNNKVDPADLTAVNTSTDTTNFTGNLSNSDTTVQAALDTLDNLEITAGVTTSDTPPSSPSNGDLWWESDSGILFIYYDSYWVQAVSGIVGPKGDTGETGIVTSATEPTNQDVLWIDTDDTANSVILPAGGTTGQVLSKTSGTDYDTEWSTVDLSTKQDDVITTQGDLIIGDASGDPVRLPVGSADQVLTSDGTTVSFQDAAGGGALGDWTLIDSGSLPTGSSSVTFSSLSGYSEYVIQITAALFDGEAALAWSLNGTGGTNVGGGLDFYGDGGYQLRNTPGFCGVVATSQGFGGSIYIKAEESTNFAYVNHNTGGSGGTSDSRGVIAQGIMVLGGSVLSSVSLSEITAIPDFTGGTYKIYGR